MSRLTLIIGFLIGCYFPGVSQGNLSSEDKKAVKLYKKADKAYQERNFTEAIELLRKATARDSNFFEAFARLSAMYGAMGQLDSVYLNYQRYEEVAPDPVASILEQLAKMAMDRGEYEKSEQYLKLFLQKVPEKERDPEIRLLSESQKYAQAQLSLERNIVSLKELPNEINRFKLQYLPALTVDQQTIFFTKRDYVQGDEDIAVSERRNGNWMTARSVSENINSPLNEGACTVSADGRTMIFASCDRRDSYGSCDLFMSKKSGDQWSRPSNLGKNINTQYWESQPSLSADGKTLYFSTNRPGGFGNRDIWVSTNEEGQWQQPVNLGKNINTRHDETTPFIHPNGTTLYFSANGYVGMGGYDLYHSEKSDSIWQAPINMGAPINTYKDEVAIVVTADGRSGMFAKEQQKNRQILESTIVEFTVPEQQRPPMASYLVGRVIDAATAEPLQAEVEVIDLGNGKTVYDSESDVISGQYFMVLPVGKELAAYVKKPGYLYADFSFKTVANSVMQPDTVEIALDRIEAGTSMVLRNIYFDLNAHELDNRSISEIENVYEVLTDNASISVEIEGHTDNSGSDGYNQELSEKRAYAVYEALIKKGVPAHRLSYRGYADSQPVKSNETETGRKANRRIEFRVLRLN